MSLRKKSVPGADLSGEHPSCRELNREIDEELRSHLDEAIESGRNPIDAPRALGPALGLREQSRDPRPFPPYSIVRY